VALTPRLPEEEEEWSRDVALMIVGWLLASVLAVVLLLTVVRWAFV
jgi:predicted anti-sigma-YlaC factor YlaD